MRFRWLIPTLLAVAGLAALLFWPRETPQDYCWPEPGLSYTQMREKGRKVMTSTSECTTSLSPEDAQRWWQAWRATILPGGGLPIDRGAFEKCQRFFPDADLAKAGDGACSNQLLLKLEADWLDWHGRFFASSIFRNGQEPAALSRANLWQSEFNAGDASGMSFSSAILRGAMFFETKLQRAHFTDADLRDAVLRGVDLGGAFFGGADLAGAVYEPVVGNLPNLASLATARNLASLAYQRTPQQLNELREAFYKAGFPEQGQKITFAIEHSRRVKDGVSPDPLRRLSSWGRLIGFEWTAAYGLKPLQPLLILIVLIPLFAPVYLAGVYGGPSGHVWIRRPENAIDLPATRWLPLRRIVGGPGPLRFLSYAGTCLWFSTMCAFRIGYRDVNVGDWITRLQPREYLLGATGWCRTVSGLQSLVSVYLLALTVLCIIGRPFG
jgi:hypothetical protein